jgi:hypothetical protein
VEVADEEDGKVADEEDGKVADGEGGEVADEEGFRMLMLDTITAMIILLEDLFIAMLVRLDLDLKLNLINSIINQIIMLLPRR